MKSSNVRKIIGLFILLSLLLVPNAAYAKQNTSQTINIDVNGQPLFKKQKPFVYKNATMVPLKEFLSAFNLTLSLNEAYGGYRLNVDDKAVLMFPGSKIALVYDINTSNFKKIDDLYEFQHKIVHMPSPAIVDKGTTYISLKFISSLLGLSMNVESPNTIHVSGHLKVENNKEYVRNVFDHLKDKNPNESSLSDFNSFYEYTYGSNIDWGFNAFESIKDVIPLFDKTIYIDIKSLLTEVKTKKQVWAPRFSEIKVIEEYDTDQCIVVYNNKQYLIDNYDLEHYYGSDPTKQVKWSKKVWDAIKQEEVFIGMTREMAFLSWGEPKDINSTTSKSGRFEQWVYPNDVYLYFTNGKLTTIQN